MSIRDDNEALARYLDKSEGAAAIYLSGEDRCRAIMPAEKFEQALADYNEVRNSRRPFPPPSGIGDFE